MSRKRNVWKKLLNNCKLNGIYQKPDGTWTINSSTNQRRMTDQRQWKPAKILITENDLEEQYKKQGEVCYWFKIPLDLNLLYKDHPDWAPKHPLAPSVDRIDDTKDYTPDNILITCRFANLGRNIYPFDKMQILIETIKDSMNKN